MLFIPRHIVDDRFHVHPDQIFQDDRPDEVRRTASCVAAVVGTDEVVLPLLKVAGGAIPEMKDYASKVKSTSQNNKAIKSSHTIKNIGNAK